MTLAELVERMAGRLDAAGVAFGHGTDNAYDEAAWLVQWRLGLPLDALDSLGAREIAAAEEHAVRALVAQRIATRRPAAYLTGEAWLQGVPFFVDERVIVPRSLVAEPLVDGTLDAWLPGAPARVLDLCTGGASLAVLAALHWPGARLVATDLSADALAVAARNVARHALGGRIVLLQGDGLAALTGDGLAALTGDGLAALTGEGLAALTGDGGAFDVVLCNPPYVNTASMAALPPEYRAEPALALAGGPDGMDFIRRLLLDVAAHLTPQGVLVLEIGHERAHFEAAFPALEPVWLPTSAGDDQVLLLARAALGDAPSGRSGRTCVETCVETCVATSVGTSIGTSIGTSSGPSSGGPGAAPLGAAAGTRGGA